MIAYLEGPLTFKSPAYVIVETAGVGYQVHISLHTWSAIQSLDKCRLYTHLHIQENAHSLYGFHTPEEKELFVQMISVSGVGPSTGRMILSTLSPDEAVQAIVEENETLIRSVKGIGPKSAKRLILELKDKVKANQQVSSGLSTPGHNTMQEEALSALVLLGFSRAASEKAIAKALADQPILSSVEELIKSALKNL